MFVEHFALPIYLEYPKEEIEPGVVQIDRSNEKRLTRADVVRQVQATLVMTPEVAFAFAKFLHEKAQAAIQARGGG